MKITRYVRPRKYVVDPRAWAFDIGTDYILAMGTTTALITSGTAGQVLSEFGWTTTSLDYVAGSGADFLTADANSVESHLLMSTTNDILASPLVFGGPSHGLALKNILGYKPTKLVLECRAAFTTASNSEQSSGFGWQEDGGTCLTAANEFAFVCSDGTNFRLRSGNLTNFTGAITGPAVDTAWHTWRITVDGTNTTLAVDGTTYGTLAIQTDEFPLAFNACVSGSNDLALGTLHIWYE